MEYAARINWIRVEIRLKRSFVSIKYSRAICTHYASRINALLTGYCRIFANSIGNNKFNALSFTNKIKYSFCACHSIQSQCTHFLCNKILIQYSHNFKPIYSSTMCVFRFQKVNGMVSLVIWSTVRPICHLHLWAYQSKFTNTYWIQANNFQLKCFILSIADLVLRWSILVFHIFIVACRCWPHRKQNPKYHY